MAQLGSDSLFSAGARTPRAVVTCLRGILERADCPPTNGAAQMWLCRQGDPAGIARTQSQSWL